MVVGGETGTVIKELCVSQATKNGWVNCSTESFRAHWDEEMTNKEK